MALPDADWLSIAQRLPVHSTRRVFHGRETRPNLVVGHEPSHYWAYCQSCKEGGKVVKDHVLVTGNKAPVASTSLSLPRDMVQVRKADTFVLGSIARFLASKHVDALYLPELWYSAERKRLLLQTEQGWLGRDLTGTSHQKWLTYTAGVRYLGAPADHTVLVEDAFSWYKVTRALQTVPSSRSLSCVCLLGTELNPRLTCALSETATSVHFLLDGDDAGKAGARRGTRALRPFGVQCSTRLPPEGCDPKDLTIAEIRKLCVEASSLNC